MSSLDDTKLENYDGEDINDVLIKLEKSFAIKFEIDSFKEVKSFGDICEVIQAHLNYEHKETCTKQQAFYKIRKAISQVQLIDESKIKLGSNLTDIFPRKNRRNRIKEFKKHIGIKADILTYPDWLGTTFGIGVVLSLIAFFFDWQIALSGVIFFIAAIKIAERLGNQLEVKTVMQLAEKLVRDHYVEIRREPGTINRNEILETIKEAFSSQLAIDKKYLTNEASLV